MKRYKPELNFGLDEVQVQERFSEGYFNKEASRKTKSVPQILKENTCTLFNLVNLVLGIFIIAVGSYKNLFFLLIAICNTAISTVQELMAKKEIDKLSILTQTKSTVMRSGKEIDIPINEIVLDDVIMYSSGNQICVDSIIEEGEVEVNESFITGESDTIYKKKGDMLLSGSFIVSGRATARVEHVGKDNYTTQIYEGTKYIKKTNSEIMKTLRGIIRVMTLIIIPLGIILYIKQINIPDNTTQMSVVNSIAAILGMIPEGLMLLTSSVLALASIRLARKNVMVQQIYCIETLARVDTICFDKTGTLTIGKMKVNKVIPIDETKHDERNVNNILANMMKVLDDDNTTANAVREFAGSVKEKLLVVSKTPFSSKNKYSGVKFEEGNYKLGASEFILSEEKIASVKLSDGTTLRAALDKYSEDYRVMTLTENGEPIAMVLISDIIRKEAKSTINYFKDQNVIVKIISGDNPITVSKIAKECDVDNYDKYIDMTTLKEGDNLKEIVEKYTIFGRVTPAQKKELIMALKANGHTTAMTGDGVNDVLALKESDCSIAMANGSDATKNISEIVLTDSNFASMPKIVQEGRQSINNVQRSASLFLTKTIFSTILAIVFLFATRSYPFMPIQMGVINLVCIGIPSFLLALELNKERVKGRFLKNIIKKSLPTGLTVVFEIVLLTILSDIFNVSQVDYSTLCIVGVATTGLMLLYQLAYKTKFERKLEAEDKKRIITFPFSIYRLAVAILMTLGFAAEVTIGKDIFDLKALYELWPNVVFTMVTTAATFVLLNILIKFIFKAKHKIQGKVETEE